MRFSIAIEMPAITGSNICTFESAEATPSTAVAISMNVFTSALFSIVLDISSKVAFIMAILPLMLSRYFSFSMVAEPMASDAASIAFSAASKF